MHDEYLVFAFILFAAVFLCGTSISSCVQQQKYRENIEKEAVQKGHGEYIRKDDDLQFQWKETSKN